MVMHLPYVGCISFWKFVDALVAYLHKNYACVCHRCHHMYILFFHLFFANKSTEDKQQQKVHKRYHTDCHRKSKYLKCLSDAHNEQRICMWHVGCGWMLHVACCCCVFTSQCICSLWHLIFGPFRNLVNTIQPAFDSFPAWHYE